MSQEVEIWFDSAPAPAAVTLALEAFGVLHEARDGTLRLVEGDEAPADALPLVLVEVARPPDAVRALLPGARAALRVTCVLTSGRGYFLARIAACVQRRLGGVVYLPGTAEAFADVESYEKSWPSEHGEAHSH